MCRDIRKPTEVSFQVIYVYMKRVEIKPNTNMTTTHAGADQRAIIQPENLEFERKAELEYERMMKPFQKMLET